MLNLATKRVGASTVQIVEDLMRPPSPQKPDRGPLASANAGHYWLLGLIPENPQALFIISAAREYGLTPSRVRMMSQSPEGSSYHFDATLPRSRLRI